MQVEDYIERVSDDQIRVKGHRIGIEHILYEYRDLRMSLEELEQSFPTLSREPLLAVLLYYHTHRAEVDAYLDRWVEWGRREREKQANDPALDGLRRRMAALREQRKLGIGA